MCKTRNKRSFREEQESSPEPSSWEAVLCGAQGTALGRVTLPLGVSFHGRFYREQPWKRRVSVARAEGRLVHSLSQR